jgi:hypothetical protein
MHRSTMIRQLRAAVAIGAIWAVTWVPLGALVGLYAAASPPQPDDFLYRPVAFPTFLLAWTIWGGLSGVGFALILGAVERRRTLGDLSVARTACWGALGAISAPAFLTAIDVAHGVPAASLHYWRLPVVSILVSAALGAACAAATLMLARRPPR